MFVVWILFLIVVEYFFFLVYFLFYFSFFFSFFLLFFFIFFFFFFSSRRRHTRSLCDWSSDGVLFRSKGPKQSFLGYMIYNRLWFDRDKYGLTIGGGQIYNPGRYLVLLPPINGATAASGTPYFTENPGDPYKAWDMSGRLIGCRANILRSVGSTTIGRRTYLIFPGLEA